MSIISNPRFWFLQFYALKQWGLAIVSSRLTRQGVKRAFFKKASNPSNTIVLVFPGVGGQYTQFYWMIQKITHACNVDLLYIQPRWGATLDLNAIEAHDTLMQAKLLGYSQYIAIGHSRGGLLAKHVLDILPADKDRILCTLATPWRAPNAIKNRDSGLRGWVSKKQYQKYLGLWFRWGRPGLNELFLSHSAPAYSVYTVASLFDPIVGAPEYQCPSGQPSSCQKASHLSLPFDGGAISYLISIIHKHNKA